MTKSLFPWRLGSAAALSTHRSIGHGRTDMKKKIVSRAGIALLVSALITGCGGNGTSDGGAITPPPTSQTVAQVIVTPSSILLQPGGTTQLAARAVDASGATVSDAVITWTASSNVVTLGSDGKVVAGNSVDSAVVTASVGGVSSAPVTALVASLNAGTQVISDSQVVSDPALVDQTQEPGVGSQLKMTLSGSTAPAVGTVIVGSGEKPISGKVVSTTPNGANTDLVFQVLPLGDVFSKLKLTQTYAKAELKQSFDVQPSQTIARTDGAREYVFTLDTPGPSPATIRRAARAIKSRTASAVANAGHPAETIGSASWNVGPFACSAKADLSAAISFRNMTPHVIDNMGPVSAAISLDQGKLSVNLSAKGSMKLIVDGEVHLSDKLTDSVSCDARLFKYFVPVPPVVAVVFVPVVPVVGLRANVSGTLTAGDVVIGIKSEVEQPLTVGMTIGTDGTFTNTSSLDANATTKFDWTLGATNPTDAVKFSGDAKAGLYVQASFTNAILELYAVFKPSYDPIKALIDAFGGFHATVALAAANEQVQDATVPAGYVLTALAEIKAGDAISSFASFLSSVLALENIVLPDLKFEPTLFSHPTGNARASLRRFQAGETVQFRVTLDPATVDPTILGNPVIGYNVKQVEIWRKTPGGQSEMLGMDVGVAGAAGSPGKNVFDVIWKADAAGTTTDATSGTGPANFYAIVVPNFGEDFSFRVGPALGWLGIAQLGGPHNQEGHRIAVDPDGNVIVATISGDPLASENRTSLGGAYEIQLFKLDPYGQLIWARNIDGPGDETVNGLALDAQGNIFISGRAVNSPLTPDNIGASGFSGWAASYSSSGNQLWLKQWQDGYYSTGEYIALGPNREVYVLGVTSQAAGDVGGDIFTYLCSDAETPANNANDCGDLTLRRLDPNTGGLIWSQMDARAGMQIARGLTVDSVGNVYTAALTGADTTTQNTGDSDADGFDDFQNRYREPSGGNWISHNGVGFAMWDSSGEVIWRSNIKNERQSTAGGFVYSDELSGGIIAAGGNLWAVVRSTGTFPDAPSMGGQDSALFQLNPQTGDTTFVRLFGSAGDDVLSLFGPTPSGGLLITGYTTGALFGPNAGGLDVLAISLGADGSQRWAQQFGGPGNDDGLAAAAAPDGSIYITGFTDGLMPATLSGLPSGTTLSRPGGGEDLFIAKMGPKTGAIQSIHPTAQATR
jgi:hypothetical protein